MASFSAMINNLLLLTERTPVAFVLYTLPEMLKLKKKPAPSACERKRMQSLAKMSETQGDWTAVLEKERSYLRWCSKERSVAGTDEDVVKRLENKEHYNASIKRKRKLAKLMQGR